MTISGLIAGPWQIMEESTGGVEGLSLCQLAFLFPRGVGCSCLKSSRVVTFKF